MLWVNDENHDGNSRGGKSLVGQVVNRPCKECRVINRSSKGESRHAANKMHRTSPLPGLG